MVHNGGTGQSHDARHCGERQRRADVMVLRVFQARAGCVERTGTKHQYQHQHQHQHHGAGLV